MIDVITRAIRYSIDSLPDYCKLDGNLGHHEWINHYGWRPDDYLGVDHHHMLSRGVNQLPEFICRHCHAIAKIDPVYKTLKRVR